MLQLQERTTVSRLDTTDNQLRRLLGTACGILLATLTGVCFVEVVLRNLTSHSLGWYDELAGFLLVWLTFLGAVLAEQRNGHIGVELVERLGPRAERGFRILTQVLLIVMQALILYHGAVLAFRSHDMAITMPISMGAMYAIVPVWALLMIAVHVMHIARLLRVEAR